MKQLRAIIFGLLIWLIYSLLRVTWKITYHESNDLKDLLQNKKTFVFAHWHGDEIPLLVIGRHFRLATMSSISADGEMMSFLLSLMGVKTSRGSSSRRSVGGLLGLLRLIKSGRNCSFAVDGPKGPIYEVKPGIFEISKTLNAPIIAGSAAANKAWYFSKSWNKAFLPKPFAQVHLVFSKSFTPVRKNQDPRDPLLQNQLKTALNEAKQQAINFVAENNARC